MPTVFSSGTQTAVINTEHQLGAAATDNANYVLVIDCSNMALGDIVEFRLKTKVLATSDSEVAYYAIYAHVQAHPNKYSPPVPSDQQLICTLKQTLGTGRNYDWSLLKVAT